MTYEGIFDEVECKQELKRAKKYIKKQADMVNPFTSERASRISVKIITLFVFAFLFQLF